MGINNDQYLIIYSFVKIVGINTLYSEADSENMDFFYLK